MLKQNASPPQNLLRALQEPAPMPPTNPRFLLLLKKLWVAVSPHKIMCVRLLHVAHSRLVRFAGHLPGVKPREARDGPNSFTLCQALQKVMDLGPLGLLVS